jgi:hypothetical protein
MRVFILNGPPGIGKDTLAENIKSHFGYPVLMFKYALYAETAKYYGTTLEYMIAIATGRDSKEMTNTIFGGISPRQALIHVSEFVIKPLHGKKYFGLKTIGALNALDGVTGTVVFSDGGFPEECGVLVEHGFDVHIVQLHHEAFNFDHDSRNYVTVPGATTHRINVTMGEPLNDLWFFNQIVNNVNQFNGADNQ